MDDVINSHTPGETLNFPSVETIRPWSTLSNDWAQSVRITSIYCLQSIAVAAASFEILRLGQSIH